MISDAQLRRLARELDVRLGYAEKNYVNSWILWAIYTSPYGDNLLFKGGTALSKLYFPETWRYSEDLDFGVEGAYRGGEEELQEAVKDAARASGIDFEVIKYRELQRDEYPTHYVDIDIQYTAVLGHKNTTSLDVMIDEHVAFASVDHLHSYEDVPEFELTAYSLEEIFAEKLRALYQRSQARDYYDLYRMITESDIDDSVIVPAFTRKCEHDGLDIDLRDGLPREKREELREGWQNTLPDLVADLPEFGSVYDTLENYIGSLVDEYQP
ncbi:nucleotidyl transferase AbiEii/AbiGii toxin family protein [Haloarcula nitratireducens]|uniref:Nucleotidyl transferase AbiEii/AbiGii toxin family protein n=1 Tax=Haloarcula nitratireducens TaxID=2487749 RepID=A0AAW4PEG2_9EURY|nr:nucleotidyl transferase AbiEii/AbiGii toxin family protein [Halomicroarcula nitratireducens]MBX0296706.1 nucleotidyl transferase AbiEii/AbiGii toxin family protein [Halomicroarcula nitratireducens]